MGGSGEIPSKKKTSRSLDKHMQTTLNYTFFGGVARIGESGQ